MRIDKTKGFKPETSFLSVEKDASTILKAILDDNVHGERIGKLMYYGSEDALSKQPLTSEQWRELVKPQFHRTSPGCIKLVPKIYLEDEARNYIIIKFDHFSPNMTNPEFRDNIISFNIICHYDQWQLENLQLRPYQIAAALDSIFNGTRLSGIGTLEFMGCDIIMPNDEFAGLDLSYLAIHGEDDKIPHPGDPYMMESFMKAFSADIDVRNGR